MALLDVAGFDRDLWERGARLRQERVPFLLLSPRPNLLLEQESRAQGGRGVLVKPLAVQQLLGAVRGLLEAGQGEDL